MEPKGLFGETAIAALPQPESDVPVLRSNQSEPMESEDLINTITAVNFPLCSSAAAASGAYSVERATEAADINYTPNSNPSSKEVLQEDKQNAAKASALSQAEAETKEEGSAEAESSSAARAAAAPVAEQEAEASKLKDGGRGSLTIPRLRGRQAWRPRGQRRSFGRLCKGSAAAGGCAGEGTASAAVAAKRKWVQKQQRKVQQYEVREAERQARAVKESIRAKRRKQREAKKQQKKENEMKSAKVQVIKNTTKIKKWSKQARRQLVKMSPELIRQLYGVQL